MEQLDYESPSAEPDDSVWRTVLPFLLLGIALWPLIYPQIVSPHGMTDWDMRISKLYFLLGFIAAYGLTRVAERAWQVFGWLLLLFPYSILVVATGWQVVQALWHGAH